MHLVHRRDALRASKIMAERTLSNPKIKPVWSPFVTEVLDVKQDKVTGVRLKHVKTSAETTLECAGCSWRSATCPYVKGALDMDESGRRGDAKCRRVGGGAIAPTACIARWSPPRAWAAPPPLRPSGI